MTMFGQKARDWRQDQDISLREMASQLGVSAVYLSDIERGHRPPPSGEKLRKMAELLHRPFDEMEQLANASRKLVFDPKKTNAKGFEVAALLARRLEDESEGTDELLENIIRLFNSRNTQPE